MLADVVRVVRRRLQRGVRSTESKWAQKMAYRSQVVLRGVVETLDEVGSCQCFAPIGGKKIITVKPSYGMDSWSAPRSDGLAETE